MTSYYNFKIFLSGKSLRALHFLQEQNMNPIIVHPKAINDEKNVHYLYIYLD